MTKQEELILLLDEKFKDHHKIDKEKILFNKWIDGEDLIEILALCLQITRVFKAGGTFPKGTYSRKGFGFCIDLDPNQGFDDNV